MAPPFVRTSAGETLVIWCSCAGTAGPACFCGSTGKAEDRLGGVEGETKVAAERETACRDRKRDGIITPRMTKAPTVAAAAPVNAHRGILHVTDGFAARAGATMASRCSARNATGAWFVNSSFNNTVVIRISSTISRASAEDSNSRSTSARPASLSSPRTYAVHFGSSG